MIKIVYWLDHPTQIDVPVFRALNNDNRVSFKAIYCVPPDREILPFDSEVGSKPGWDFDMLEGYKYGRITATFSDGWSSANRLLHANKPCLGIVQNTGLSVFRGVIAASWLRHYPLLVKYDATIHYKTPFPRSAFKRLLLPVFFGSGLFFGYTGSWAKEYLLHYGANENHLFWYPYTVDHDWLAKRASKARIERSSRLAKLGIGEECLVFLVAAKFVPREAPLDPIQAFARIASPQIHLLVIGDGPQRAEIESFLFSHPQLWRQIHLIGYVSYSKLAEYYGMSDVFIHPAHSECWGVSVNEAMACGLPVIAADSVGAGADLVEDGVTGYRYNRGNIDALSKIMLKMLENRSNLSEMKQSVLKRIEHWDPQMTTNRIIDWAAYKLGISEFDSQQLR